MHQKYPGETKGGYVIDTEVLSDIAGELQNLDLTNSASPRGNLIKS